jgi:hypothetical protein
MIIHVGATRVSQMIPAIFKPILCIRAVDQGHRTDGRQKAKNDKFSHELIPVSQYHHGAGMRSHDDANVGRLWRDMPL